MQGGNYYEERIMLSSIRKILTLTAVSIAFAGVSSNVLADATWQKDHPRRTEVNGRLGNQNKRIQTEVKNGKLSKTQALALHRDDHQIRTEERDMASQNGTHVTKQEQNTLNQQENAVSQQIGK
jgi:hypothetical protein